LEETRNFTDKTISYIALLQLNAQNELREILLYQFKSGPERGKIIEEPMLT
jgi:hypothetical protein